MNDFIRRQGPAFLAHLLRRISDELVRGADHWYPQVGVSAAPRTTSTLLALDEHGPLGVTEISALLRQSHPLVISWIKQLKAAGLIDVHADETDGRRTVVMLTRKGAAEVRRLRKALVTMGAASQALMDEAAPGVFDALWRMERVCRDKPFVERLQEHAAGASTRKPRKRPRKSARDPAVRGS
ncbi:MAG: MarR family winged helix-turn-helix transcriptional regulator [Rhodanobacteraceae bacterium]